MAFNVTPNPTEIALAAGESADVVFSFEDVPADIVAQLADTWLLGAVTVVTNIQATLDNPAPSHTPGDRPAEVTGQLLSIDETQAVIRYTRA